MASHAKQKSRTDIHQAVTDRIIAMLETAQHQGFEMPWCRPGVAHSRPTNVASRNHYRGINVLSLWGEADVRNFRTGLWGTYRQWQALGAQVRNGETATPIVFYKPLVVAADATTPKPPPDRGMAKRAVGDVVAKRAASDDGTKTIRMLKGYWAFNADQVDGAP